MKRTADAARSSHIRRKTRTEPSQPCQFATYWRTHLTNVWLRASRSGVYNKRGVTSRGLTEGGQQEYDLADKYAAWAEAVQTSHPRTSAALRGILESYREEGSRNDEEARRFMEGMDF